VVKSAPSIRKAAWSRHWFACASWLLLSTVLIAQNDPGPRGAEASVGGPVANLSVKEAKFFESGANTFGEVASVTGGVSGTVPGLGPRFNSISCVSCHAHPAPGGSSPALNPQVAVAPPWQVNPLIDLGITRATGPAREVRFSTDGAVHDLFTIAGLPGTPSGCTTAMLRQPDFAAASLAGILRFRVPTPTFGLGLIEAIPDATIEAYARVPKPFGITGTANRNSNDGTITRYGWKAQNKSLLLFSGEAYNVEQGITNELFPDERGDGNVADPAVCRSVVPAPQDSVHYEQSQAQRVVDDVNNFATFMRFLAPPIQATSYGAATAAQIAAGEAAFDKAGCSVCHRKSMTTGNHATAALAGQVVTLFSDLLVHDVGTGDGIQQGLATGDQFRTAPLWGVGQRLFFLHDGRTSDIVEAIRAHGGEATRVINNFDGVSTGADAPFNLNATERQNLAYFLRSL
jgi:CxxC motif-containing protein (DUF1111 family)